MSDETGGGGTPTRREYVRYGTTVDGGGLLAGCAGGSGDGGTPADTPTSAPTDAPTQSTDEEPVSWEVTMERARTFTEVPETFGEFSPGEYDEGERLSDRQAPADIVTGAF